MTMKVRLYFCFYALLMAFASLFSGCSADDSTPSEAADEIRFNADVWRVMEGTRATTFVPGAVNGSFMVYAYYSTTPYSNYINGERVNYSDGVSSWVNRQNWPRGGESLDFFTYMPTSLTNTCCSFDPEPYDEDSNPDGYSPGNPRIVCTSLPMTYNSASPTVGQGSGLQEFVYALTTGQSEASNGDGVVLTFRRPFARIKMQLSASHPDIHINSITFKGLRNNGLFTYTNNPQWATTGNATNLVVTLNRDFNDNSSDEENLRQIGPEYIMIPQTWDGNIEVKATWIDWGELFEHTVSTKIDAITWRPGYNYTYTFTISETDLRVDKLKFTEQW